MEQDALLVVQDTFAGLWTQVVAWLPAIIGAIIIFIVGLIIAWALRVVVEKVITAIRIDDLMVKLKITAAFKKAGIGLNVSRLLGWIVKWFVIIVFLVAAADILGWTQITVFLNEVATYIPNAIIAIVILLVGIVLGAFVYDVVMTAVKAAKLGGAHLLAGISKWAIFIFAFVAALEQLGIATTLLQTLTTGLIAMLALAGGLAFGLGGKDEAHRFLSKLKKDISHGK